MTAYLAYEFEADRARFRWVIEGAVSAGALIRVDDADRSVPVYPITESLDLDDTRVPARPFAFADLLPPATGFSVEEAGFDPSPADGRAGSAMSVSAQERGASRSSPFRDGPGAV